MEYQSILQGPQHQNTITSISRSTTTAATATVTSTTRRRRESPTVNHPIVTVAALCGLYPPSRTHGINPSSREGFLQIPALAGRRCSTAVPAHPASLSPPSPVIEGYLHSAQPTGAARGTLPCLSIGRWGGTPGARGGGVRIPDVACLVVSAPTPLVQQVQSRKARRPPAHPTEPTDAIGIASPRGHARRPFVSCERARR